MGLALRTLLAVVVGVSFGLSGRATADEPAAHPNIVLIIIDMLRADRVGAYGYPAPTSPELDVLARDGVRFARVVSQCTWTRPSIASLLTSLHPRTLGLYAEENHALDPRHQTLAEVLRANGYWTAGATANPNANRVFHFDQGFDHYVDSEVLFPRLPGGREQQASGRKLQVARSREVLLGLLDYARTQPKGPGFLQAVLMDVHEYQKIPEPVGGPYDALSDATPSRDERLYLKALRYTSREIGLFLRSLSGIPGWENTLVVVTSDHGESLGGDHPSLAHPKWHGYLVYETQTLVPWILFSTAGALPAGRVVERPVRLLDLMPTLLDAAGIPIPEALAGTSLMPIVRSESEAVELPDRFVVETRFRESDKIAVYSDDWIYVETRDAHPGTSPRELQRVGEPADGSRTDRSADNAGVADELRAYLDDWRARFPTAEPTLVGNEPGEATREQLRALGYID